MNQLHNCFKEFRDLNHVGTRVAGIVKTAHAGGFFVEIAPEVDGHVDILVFASRQNPINSLADYPVPGSLAICEVLGYRDDYPQVVLSTDRTLCWPPGDWKNVSIGVKISNSFGFLAFGSEDANNLLRMGFKLVFVASADGIFEKSVPSQRNESITLIGSQSLLYFAK